MTTRAQFKYCYVDESLHDNLGFVAVGFVFAQDDPDADVAAALRAAGIDPDTQEFKSGARMDRNPSMQSAREHLLEVVRKKTSVAVVIGPRHHSVPLGKQCLQALQSVLVRNGIAAEGLSVYFDDRIFDSAAQAIAIKRLFAVLESTTLYPSEDSRRRRGIQLADLMAHTFSQVVREGLTGAPKLIDLGGADSGFEEGAQMPLSEFLLVSFRHSILARRMVSEGQPFDPATDPVVCGPDEDPTEYGLNPEILGWGVQVAPEAREPLRRAVHHLLERIWLGCWH